MEGGAAASLEVRLLAALGVPAAAIAAACADGSMSPADHVMATGAMDEDVWWRAVANVLGLDYCADLGDAALDPLETLSAPVADLDRRIEALRFADARGARTALAPAGAGIDRVAGYLASHPLLAGRVVIASRRTLRSALRRRLEPVLMRHTLADLPARHPQLSAARPPRRSVVALVGGVMVLSPVLILIVNLWVATAFLMICLTLGLARCLAAIDAAVPVDHPPVPEAELPTYAVLVPLYRESAVLPDLVAALAALDYPATRLDIKLVVEAADAATRRPAEAAAAARGWDVVVVPAFGPLTKPKALCYALQLVEAELVTVFDAEDRPAPDQLRVAAAAFRALPAGVACLQAALVADRPVRPGWLSRQFAMEYRVLFQGLLPWLARQGRWFPIGGTSNHFRTAVLKSIGAWDPYNVTEDADVAVRLARLGYRIGMIRSATSDEPPDGRAVWMAQRSRWIKGWMQTSWVHLRHPLRLMRDLGAGGTLLFAVMLIGQIASVFVFPASVLALALIWTGLRPVMEHRPLAGDVQLVAALAALALNWAGTALLAWRTRPPGDGVRLVIDLITVPVYWLMQFAAAVRAAYELARHPFRWNKTPHGQQSKTATPSPAALDRGRATG